VTWIPVSARTGSGIPQLRQAILDKLQPLDPGEGLTGMTASRCRLSLESAIDALRRAKNSSSLAEGDEFVTQEIRSALLSIGEVTGAIYTEDLLDKIFSRFCIGK